MIDIKKMNPGTVIVVTELMVEVFEPAAAIDLLKDITDVVDSYEMTEDKTYVRTIHSLKTVNHNG
jgi:hypothetical protein